MKKLYLVDVSSMFFRAFYAIPPLSNDSGMPTNALYGFLSMTIKLLREIKPDYLAFCFDSKEPSFRVDMYPEYKANRAEMPENLVPQVPFVKKLTELLGVHQEAYPGYEADDIIGTLTRWGRERDLEVVIVSGDKDFAQLVAPFVTMYDTMKDVRYDVEGVKAKWGISPEQMIDYLALVGDSSDNIPGVRGVGPKSAQKLLQQFNTLDGIYENIESVSGKALKAKLIEHKDKAMLSKQLVTIVQNMDMDVKEENLKLRPIHREDLRALLQELGFKSFEKTLFADEGHTPEKTVATEVSTAGVGDIIEVEWGAEELEKQLQVGSEIWGMLTERGFFLGYKTWVIKPLMELEALSDILNSKLLKWKAYDLKEVWKYLQIRDPYPLWDQMLAAYVIRAGVIESFEAVYKTFYGRTLPDLISPQQLYAAHLQLEKTLKDKLKLQNGEAVLTHFELPLVPVLYEMERLGVEIDVEELARQSKSLEKDLRDLEQLIHKEAGGSFNVASPKQLAQVLFERMGLTTGKKTKTGYSTNSDVLEKLVAEHSIAQHILDYRELAKIKSTYVDAIPQLVNKKTGRLHTHFRQAATSTGRLSSVNPNIQNIPIRTERGKMVRKAFVSRKGYKFISVDYSQIELRILAHMSGDSSLCQAFRDNLDIHAATASEIYRVPLGEVTSDLRRKAKAVNFGIAYGQGVYGLSESLRIDRSEASDIIGRYFSRFPQVKDYMDSMIRQGLEKGYVETIFGRRRYLDELKSRNQNIRKFGERAAINAPIQGTASDLVKLAMIRLREEVSTPMLLQVHDELLFECPEAEVDEQIELICPVMEQVADFKVPLKVNAATGYNWHDAHA